MVIVGHRTCGRRGWPTERIGPFIDGVIQAVVSHVAGQFSARGEQFFLTFVSRKWRIFSRPLCSRSSPRHFQQDLAATELMRHRVLDMLEGVHARHRDSEGAVGY